MKNHQKGFSVVGVLIVIVIVGLISGAGWLVYDRQKSNSDNKETTNQTSQQEQKLEAPKEEVKTNDDALKYMAIKEWGVNYLQTTTSAVSLIQLPASTQAFALTN